MAERKGLQVVSHLLAREGEEVSEDCWGDETLMRGRSRKWQVQLDSLGGGFGAAGGSERARVRAVRGQSS